MKSLLKRTPPPARRGGWSGGPINSPSYDLLYWAVGLSVASLLLFVLAAT